jgi:hypothetical protein
MIPIKTGDSVKHKHQNINDGLPMNVLDIVNEQALCDYFEGHEMINKQKWFDIRDLEVVTYGDGGFKNEGE